MRNTSFIFAALTLAACGGGNKDMDMGGTDAGPGTDSGPGMDMGPAGNGDLGISYVDPDTMMLTLLPEVAGSMGAALDTSCVGMHGVPSEMGTPASTDAHAKDFQMGFDVPMVMANFYPNNQMPFDHSCTAPCMTATTDATGHVMTFMDVQNSWYAYYMGAHMGTDMAHTAVPTAEFNEPFDTAGITLNSVSQQTLALIPTLLGLHRQTGTSIVAGTVYDCMDHPVKGAVIRIFDKDGNLIREPPDGTMGAANMPAYRYFGPTDLPSASQYFTNDDGLYATANMPTHSCMSAADCEAPSACNIPMGMTVGSCQSASIRVEAWVMHGGTPQIWGCESIKEFADGVTIINVRPYRSDGPSDCSAMLTHF